MNGMSTPVMHGAAMPGMTMTLPLFVLMMAAMMLPSAVPAIMRRASAARVCSLRRCSPAPTSASGRWPAC